MIVEDSTINPILRIIDVYYIDGLIGVSEAEDLSESIIWIVNKSLNESNVNYVIDTLRSYKKVMDKEIVCKVINEFRKICGGYMK